MKGDDVGVSLAELENADFSHRTMSFADYLHRILVSCRLLRTKPKRFINCYAHKIM